MRIVLAAMSATFEFAESSTLDCLRAVASMMLGGLLICTTLGCGQAPALQSRGLDDDAIKSMASRWPNYQPPHIERLESRLEAEAQPEQPATVADAAGSIAPVPPTTPSSPLQELREQAARRPRPQKPPFKPLIQPIDDWDLHTTAFDALARIGESAVPALIQSLQDEEPKKRWQAAKVLARIGPDARDAIEPLIRALRDPHPRVQKAAAAALGQIGPAAEAAIEPLMEILDQSIPVESADQTTLTSW